MGGVVPGGRTSDAGAGLVGDVRDPRVDPCTGAAVARASCPAVEHLQSGDLQSGDLQGGDLQGRGGGLVEVRASRQRLEGGEASQGGLRTCWTARLMSTPCALRAILIRSPRAEIAPCAQHDPQSAVRSSGGDDRQKRRTCFAKATWRARVHVCAVVCEAKRTMSGWTGDVSHCGMCWLRDLVT